MNYLDIGSFTELAAIKALELIGEGELNPLDSPREVAIATKRDRDSYGILAHENSIAGVVKENNALVEEFGLVVVHRIVIPITPCLGTYPGGKRDSVYSHPKALAQCSDFLAFNYPNAQKVEVSSTAKGIQLVKEGKSGLAIGRKDYLIKQGLEVLAEGIANRKSYTEFYVVRA